MSDETATWLIADVGATSSRIAITDGSELAGTRFFRNDDWPTLEALLQHFVAAAEQKPVHCALAVAAPIDGEEVVMCNREWQFTRGSLTEIGFENIEVINDFHAIAHALPAFDDASRTEIGTASKYRPGNIAVLGPGSGLGMAAWIDGKAAMCGEGGHITIAGRDEAEDEIIAGFRQKYGHCSAERILSGPGLRDLYTVMHGDDPGSSEAITENPDDPQNRETLLQFFRFLAGVAADLALITGAYGGLYMAGGIVPACIDVLKQSGFRRRFENKNRYSDYMRAIPTWVITDPVPGLTGLVNYIHHQQD